MLYSAGPALRVDKVRHVKESLARFQATKLAGITAFALLVPLAAGLAVDRAFGTGPWAGAAGAIAGIALSSVAITQVILRRYDRLAPPPKEPQ